LRSAEAERHRILSERFSDVEVRERGLNADARRLNSVVLELNRLVAKLRWDAAVVERERLEDERGRRALSAGSVACYRPSRQVRRCAQCGADNP
jgi:hypothetical protein